MAQTRKQQGSASPAATSPSVLFAVRVWQEETAGTYEYRGCVRDVVTGAFRSFREWSDLATFMVARMEERDGAPRAREEGETP
jgi:hypothetical protein